MIRRPYALVHNARYAKLSRQIDVGNWNGFQRDFQLKILEARSLTFVVEEYTRIVDVSPVLIDKVRIPVGLEPYRRTKIRTDYILFCDQEWLGNVNHTTGRLRWASARFLNDNISIPQLPLRKGARRNKSFWNRRKIIRLYRHNIGRPYAKGRLHRGWTSRFFSPFSADKLSNCVIQSFHIANHESF